MKVLFICVSVTELTETDLELVSSLELFCNPHVLWREKSEPRAAEVTYTSRSPNSRYCQGKNSGVRCGGGGASQGKAGQGPEIVTQPLTAAPGQASHCRCFGPLDPRTSE